MRSPLVCLLLVAAFVRCSYAGDGALPVVTHRALRVAFQLTDHRIRAEADLTLANRTDAPVREIPLLLYRLFNVDRVSVEGDGVPALRQSVVALTDEPSLQAREVVVTLPEPLPPGGTVRLTIGYGGFLFGYPEVMAYVRDRIDKEYALLRPDAYAYPMVARPSFESTIASYNDLFSYDVEATVPNGYVAACGGEAVGTRRPSPDSTTFIFKSKVPTWRLDLAVAPFRLVRDSSEEIVVYHLPEDSAGARAVARASGKVSALYAALFGRPRQARGYTVIEIPEGWGSQAGDLYFLQTAAAFKDTANMREVYHEIGHSWNARASAAVQRSRYFDEAFASYFAALALRAFEGEARYREEMERSRDRFRRSVASDSSAASTPIAEYGARELGRHSYTKGAWSLYVLARLIGDDAFARVVRAMLHESGETDFQGFQRICEREAGRELGRFFNEWIYGATSSSLLTGGVDVDVMAGRYR
jgi:hypothetical protein